MTITSLPPVYQILLSGLAVTAAFYDMRFRRIPNWLVLMALIVGVTINLVAMGVAGLKLAMLGAGAAFLVYFPLFVVRGMGAGDVKLMMAIGALVGPQNWIGIFMLTAIFGAAIAIVVLLLRRRLIHTLWNVSFILSQL